MALPDSLRAIADGIAQLRADTGADDAQVGRAVRQAARERDVPAEFHGDPAQVETLYRLAWWVFVRAPARDVRWLLLGPMSLDLIAGGDRGLDELLDDLAALEDGEPVSADDLDLADVPRAALATLQTEGGRGDEVAGADAARLEDILDTAMGALLEDQRAFRRLYGQLTDTFVGEFDELARSGAFEEALHHDHDHHHDHDWDELDSAQAYAERAEHRYTIGDLDGAIEDATAALDLDDDLVAAWIHRGVAFAAQEKLEQAIADFSEALERDPDLIAARINRGLAYYGLDDLEIALEDFEHAIEVEPERGTTYVNRGIVRFGAGDVEGAIADFDRAIALIDEPIVTPYTNRALARRATGDLAGAIEDYKRALQIDPAFADAWASLGYIFLEGGYPEQAIEHFEKAAQLQPYEANHPYNLGNTYAELERYDDAVDAYTQAIDIDPEDVPSYLNRGLARLKLEDFRGAIDDWSQAIDIDPYDPMPYAKRAGVWHLLDQPREAAQDLVQALEVAPNDWEYEEEARRMLDVLAEELGYDPTQRD